MSCACFSGGTLPLGSEEPAVTDLVVFPRVLSFFPPRQLGYLLLDCLRSHLSSPVFPTPCFNPHICPDCSNRIVGWLQTRSPGQLKMLYVVTKGEACVALTVMASVSGLQHVGSLSLLFSSLNPNLDFLHPGRKTDQLSFKICEWNWRRVESRYTLLLNAAHSRFLPFSSLAQTKGEGQNSQETAASVPVDPRQSHLVGQWSKLLTINSSLRPALQQVGIG